MRDLRTTLWELSVRWPWYHYYLDSGRQELFDLSQDRGELHDLSPQQAQRCHEYRRRVGGLLQYQRRFLAQHGAP